ncbi:MAG: HAD-IA family hydrolase [Candidatus Omnitrophica bacterium]|nr:HAD-IA family hydrolase [Candidatus Omnitrophota bacterium]
MSQKVKAIFFDAGGTLFRPYPSVGEIYAREAARYGGAYNAEALEAEFCSAWKKRGGLSSLGEETNEAKERGWWRALVREVFEPQGGVPHFDDFFHALHRSFVEKHLWEIYPEVIDVLEDFQEKGIILGVVSNWDLRLPKVLKNLGLHAYFDFFVGSSACGATKPSEKIFKEALKQARTQPEKAVHVGDTYEEDFVGAERLGIKAFLLDRSGSGNSVPDHLRIHSLAELRERI